MHTVVLTSYQQQNLTAPVWMFCCECDECLVRVYCVFFSKNTTNSHWHKHIYAEY